MTINLTVCPPFSEDWTYVTIEGEDEVAVANVLVSRLAGADWEVEEEDEECLNFGE